MTAQRRGSTRTAKRRVPWGVTAVAAVVMAVVVLVGIVVAFAVVQPAAAVARGQSTEVARKVTVEGSALSAFPESGTDRAVGQVAPTLKSVDFKGKDVQAGGATGEPYALVFLAHWCPHCQKEVPVIVSLEKQFQKHGVAVTGIATGTSSDYPNYPPSEWLADEEWPYGVLVDDGQRAAAEAYGLTSYPFLVFVDAQGEVAGRISGEVPKKALKKIVAALAAGKPLPYVAPGASSGS